MSTYRIKLPYPRPPLSANQRLHWAAKAKLVRELRTTVAWLARAQRIPAGQHLVVGLEWAPGDRKKRDADNLWPTLKACVDALARGPRRDLIGLDLVPDDTDEWVTRLAPRILPPPAEPGLWLVVEVRGSGAVSAAH